jgi:hypothetical protein
MANGPESSGGRTHFLHRRGQVVDTLGKPLQGLYAPPSHRKYTPLERWWGMLEFQEKGTHLRDAKTRLEWAKRRTWQGLKPVGDLSRKVYAPGVTLSKTARQAVEVRLERNPLLPKWDILIHPTRAT